MKKRIIGLGAIVAGVLIAPNIIGSKVESKYKETLIKAANNPFITIIESDFKRSWFSAEASMKLTVEQASELGENFTIEVIDTMSFGPIIVNSSGLSFNLATSVVDLNLPQNTDDIEIQEVYELLDTIERNLNITTQLSYGLSYNTHIEFEEFTKSDEHTSIFLEAMYGDITIAKDQSISSNITWNGLKLTGPEVQIDFDGLTVQSEQTLISGDIYEGSAVFSGSMVAQLPKLTVTTLNEIEVFSFDKARFEATSTVDNNLMNIHSIYHIDALHAQNEKAENLHLDFTIKNLGAESLKKMNDYLIDLPKHADEAANAQQVAEVMAMFDELLSNNPEINIDELSLIVPEGRIHANLYTSLASDAFSVFNPVSGVTALTAKTEINAPSEFFERLGLNPFIDIYISQGLIIKDNTELKAAASFKAGQLEVNGNILPLF